MLEKKIKSAVIGEMLRIALFVIYYILLIVLGVAIICGVLFMCSHWWLVFFNGATILFTIGLVLLSLLFGVYLVKPLFAFKKRQNETNVEIFESECPELCDD